MQNEYTALIQSLGFDVYMSDAARATWCYYTDGKRIGYAQWSAYRCGVSSVHIANKTTGTGFGIADEITAESVRQAIACDVPKWASARDAAATRKYDDFAHFARTHFFKLTKLDPPAAAIGE